MRNESIIAYKYKYNDVIIKCGIMRKMKNNRNEKNNNKIRNNKYNYQ